MPELTDRQKRRANTRYELGVLWAEIKNLLSKPGFWVLAWPVPLAAVILVVVIIDLAVGGL